MQNLKNKPFQEVPGGEYDPFGFYYTPNGSFWDPDGIHFNAEGCDVHDGFYDEKLEYIPGPGWITELLCYEDEKDQILNSIKSGRPHMPHGNLAGTFEDDLDEEGDIEEFYEEIDYDKLMREEERKNQSSYNNANYNTELLGSGDPQAEKRKAYNPKDAAQAHFNNMKNLANDVNIVNMKFEGSRNFNNQKNYENKIENFKENKAEKVSENGKEREKPVITPDMLFNKIPENLRPKNNENINEQVKENVIKKETTIEVESLFD